MVLKFYCASESPTGLLKIQTAGPTSRISDSVGEDGGLRISISNMFPDDAEVADSGTTLILKSFNTAVEGLSLVLL